MKFFYNNNLDVNKAPNKCLTQLTFCCIVYCTQLATKTRKMLAMVRHSVTFPRVPTMVHLVISHTTVCMPGTLRGPCMANTNGHMGLWQHTTVQTTVALLIRSQHSAKWRQNELSSQRISFSQSQ